jgi:type III secretory pathway component EscV
LQLLNEVLRRLLQEQVRIRDLDLILRVLAKHTTDEKDPDALTELVRSELRHAITHDVAGGTSPLEVVRLDGFLEETLRRALSLGPSGTSLPMPPSASQDVRLALTRALSSVPSGPRGPVLLVPPDLRRTVRALVQGAWPDVRVLCPREILPETQVRCVATATLRNLPDPEASEA